MAKLRIAGVIAQSTVDGPGIRYTIFTQGCPHNCEGCHNPYTHDPSGGREIDTSELFSQIKKQPILKGVTFSGGEPFDQAEALAVLGEQIAALKKDIIVYSGYTFEQLVKMAETDIGVKRLLTVANYLIDGRFEMDKHDKALLYRGSSNQRILDINCYPNSLKVREIKTTGDF